MIELDIRPKVWKQTNDRIGHQTGRKHYPYSQSRISEA